MTCRVIQVGAATAIVCSRGRASSAPCGFCHARHTLLCDGPGAKPGTTCDAKLCAGHATKFIRAGKKVDFCPRCTDAARAGD